MTNNTITMKEYEERFVTGLEWGKRKEKNAITL